MAGEPASEPSASWADQVSREYALSPSASSTTSTSSPSASSTTSTSSPSGSSIDAPSSRSSVSSRSVDWPSSSDADNSYSSTSSAPANPDVFITSHTADPLSQPRPQPDVLHPAARQNPRRTRHRQCCNSEDGKSITPDQRPPPSLVRQSERKEIFVDSLVDTTTQMIETIWPLSTFACGRDPDSGSNQEHLIGLRTFVQEVLRRSRTSYSTLQVALYYLVLVQSCIPTHDFTMEQSEDSSACRAMQCGRRMFLSALILASKYLQDRNYSARAWCKISGLTTCEINSNEITFLSAVKWKLHIPESVFHRWTDLVLKYSPSAQVHASTGSSSAPLHPWRTIVPHLTPDLDSVDFGLSEMSGDWVDHSPSSRMSSPRIPADEVIVPRSGSNDPTPTNPYTIPRVLEPSPRTTKTNDAVVPPLPRLSLLPTPQLTPPPTPHVAAFCTPAVGASGDCAQRSSMSSAMIKVRESGLARSTLDNPCEWKPKLPVPVPPLARRSCLARSASSLSSPESLISDVPSRPSRSSSISSIASSTRAPPPPKLAVQATRRCANLALCEVKEERSEPSILHASPEQGLSWDEEYEAFHAGNEAKSNPSKSPRTASNPHISCSASTREAAAALQELALSRQRPPPVPSLAHVRAGKGVKRARPKSMDLSVQATVRDLIAPRCLNDIANLRSKPHHQNHGPVLTDSKVAESFLLRDTEKARSVTCSSDGSTRRGLKPSICREGLSRKRTCAGSDRGGREEARIIERSVKNREGMGLDMGVEMVRSSSSL